jgi:GTP cyclohydrolase I
MPSSGFANVALSPRERLVGIGTVTRVVDAFARRLALQERIGEDIVAALHRHVAPRWAACRIVLAHTCMTARGERSHGARVETVARVGERSDDAALYAALGVGR